MNKLIRTVKKKKTALKYIQDGLNNKHTVFCKTIRGYKSDGTVSSNVVQNRYYEIFEGVFNKYPYQLAENEFTEQIYHS